MGWKRHGRKDQGAISGYERRSSKEFVLEDRRSEPKGV